MVTTFEVESTLTDRYQTTVPENVRRALKLSKRDKIHYSIRSSGEVVLSRVEISDEPDPAIGQFLDFLAHDLSAHPERIQMLNSTLAERIHSLVGNMHEIDLDAILLADDE
ncbi:MAG: type II toxin-antitoxin system PrlF family antitoxin [Arenimonas sp.]|nr:type II toxin-antitoxin system PrlF family antitoxin [Arenimonas sp.]MBP6309194.1 type II toxin-antitoxin system PrlF family antitoxin [Arenimonas sp.]